MPDDFAYRLELAMRQVARDVGVASAYPPTPQGQRAALRARLHTIESSREWGSDFQRTLVLRALREMATTPPQTWPRQTLLGKSKTRGQTVWQRTFEGQRGRIHSGGDTHSSGVGD